MAAAGETRATGLDAALDGASDEVVGLAYALGASLVGYPDAAFLARVQHLLHTAALRRFLAETGGLGVLAPMLSVLEIGEDALDDLRAEYIECFERGALSPLYEGEYGRARSVGKTAVLADLGAFYQAFGFDLDDGEGAETGDHLAVELEFMALLRMKRAALVRAGDAEGVEIVDAARIAFLTHHLGGFVAGAATRVEVSRSVPFGSAVRFIAGLVGAECRALGVDPVPLEAGGSASESEEMKCGSCALTALTAGA